MNGNDNNTSNNDSSKSFTGGIGRLSSIFGFDDHSTFGIAIPSTSNSNDHQNNSISNILDNFLK